MIPCIGLPDTGTVLAYCGDDHRELGAADLHGARHEWQDLTEDDWPIGTAILCNYCGDIIARSE